MVGKVFFFLLHTEWVVHTYIHGKVRKPRKPIKQNLNEKASDQIQEPRSPIMISLVARTGRRGVLVGVVGIASLFIVMAVVRDLNTKLVVMTASNQNYQKMTDSQAQKITQLQKTLQEEQEQKELNNKQSLSEHTRMKKAHEGQQREMQTKLAEVEGRLAALQKEHSELQREFQNLSQKHIQMNHHVSRLEAENEQLEAEVARFKHENDVHFAKIAQDRDNYKEQYLALFKQHQANTDSIQTLEREKERLQRQLNHMGVEGTRSNASHNQSSKSPHLNPPLAPGAKPAPVSSSSTSSSAKNQVLNLPLQEPVAHGGVSYGGGAGLSKSSSTEGVVPRVGAEPPLARNLVVPPHEIRKEDVMEAPKPGEFRNYLHGQIEGNANNQIAQPVVKKSPSEDDNLDRAVDGVKQANPEILDRIDPNGDQADVEGEEEDDQDDAVDGELGDLQRYQKAPTNPRGHVDGGALALGQGDEDEDVNYDQDIIHGFQRHHGQNRGYQPAGFPINQPHFGNPNIQPRRYVQAPEEPVRFAQRPWGHQNLL
ncbi:hypothetical protein TCAL_04691 [Tigriopus californicus]|uniref:Golgi integral membrane protein 4 n=1 Tax=Tigriopus californicus TaxID=6832 RepID=A0A553NTJ2_TIGCA|nr:C-Jun-amino-terminal kinase-interacting protein 4-like [Tigriopus californicus]TRY68752.1 hypothetical protein TCAL_04691 [Tigriopus californicus]